LAPFGALRLLRAGSKTEVVPFPVPDRQAFIAALKACPKRSRRALRHLKTILASLHICAQNDAEALRGLRSFLPFTSVLQFEKVAFFMDGFAVLVGLRSV
jgi:hypothetical protein